MQKRGPGSNCAEHHANPYDRVALVYDALGALYSQGGIGRAKRAHLDLLQSGQRVLYAGAGSGEECFRAAQNGAEVTVVDSSSAMLDRCRSRFSQSRFTATFLQKDVLTLRSEARWDMVVAPFFLNTFSEKSVPFAMRALVKLVRSGGRFLSVDFRGPSTQLGKRLLQKAYYLPPLALFSVLTKTPWHRLYDYEEIARHTHLPLTLQERLYARAFGLRLYETLVWEVQ